jgi:hypothetical protein
MAAQKYLKQLNGVLTEVSANQTSAGAGDGGKIVALTDAGRLDSSVMPVGIGAETDIVTTSEALLAGDFVNVWASTGAKARKADASVAGKEATHFVLVGFGSGVSATLYRISQTNNVLTGMTPGAKQYLSPTTAGQRAEVVPSGAGQVIQLLGVAISATELVFQPAMPVTLA